MIISYLLIGLFLINYVASHGQIYSPKSRSTGYNGHGCYVAWDQHYLQGMRCKNVCGNGWNWESGEIDPVFENTGPIQATYKMGNTIEIKFDQTGHAGYTRFRLCKLAKPTDRVNQECLDQNLLEITKLTSVDMKLKDKYTIEKQHTIQNASVVLKLPDGLLCENCVLQYEWITTSHTCSYANGTAAPREYCLNQIYKICVDIKIVSNPERPSQVYKANPVQSVYSKTPDHDPVFWYQDWPAMRKDASGNFLRPASDPLKFKGKGKFGLACFATGKHILSQYVADPAFGKMCRENCMSADKKCPDDCLCRWFEFDSLHTPPTVTLPTITSLPYWSQCGGTGFTGSTNCGQFAKCVVVNQNYSQCQPTK